MLKQKFFNHCFILINKYLIVMMKKQIVFVSILLIAALLIAGILIAVIYFNQEKINMYTYPLSANNKTYIVTLETNWNEENAPSVSLLNTSLGSPGVELYFLGATEEKTISYNITIPTDLLWGNISLVKKYYLQDPESYTLINNGTHNCLHMTFDYVPFFSGIGYFNIFGTEGAW